MRALPTSLVNHQATHFGYAARGCGGGRVPRSKAPPQLGENSEKPGAHRVLFGSEMPRLPSLVQRKEGAASSAGGGTAHGLSPGKKPWRVRGTSDCPGGFWRLLAGQKSRPRPRPWADTSRALRGFNRPLKGRSAPLARSPPVGGIKKRPPALAKVVRLRRD